MISVRDGRNKILRKFQVSLHWIKGPISDPASSARTTIGDEPSQLVTAEFHNATSCSLVPPKCSTKSSPKTSLATLPDLVMRMVAASRD